jgi:serine/threonine-protein kinase HipA
MTTLYVYGGSESAPQEVGLAYVNFRKGRLSSSFAYSQEYLQTTGAYQIDPELELQTGNWPLAGELPGCFLDSAPDRWGRNLINKQFAGRKLNNLDYLLAVSDRTRQGALRFKTTQEEAFQHPSANVPKLLDLPQLLDASNAIDHPKQGQEAIKYLLEAGSGSLGGARPKAIVEKNGQLYLAKFPHKSDETNVIATEFHALMKARSRGMDVPDCELVSVGGADVLLIKRFDRDYTSGENSRIGYLSAMSALVAVDGEQRDYLEIIDFITRYGSRPKSDIAELLRRIRYTIEINNTDDHLRNHGFLHEKGGWHLSPLFDINPNPNPNSQRQTTLGGATDAEGSWEVLQRLEKQYVL